MLWKSWTNPNVHHLGVKRRVLELKLAHPMTLKSRGVVMVVDDEFKSQPCKTIHYTHGEKIEGLRCCELPKSVQTYSILVSKVECRQANFDPIRDWKPCCCDHYRVHMRISIFSIHYTYNEKLEGLRCCEIFESIQTYTILVWNVGASYQKFHHHPWLKK